MKLDKSYLSYLAAGVLPHGFAVAIISYTLYPDVRIGDIVNEAARAIEHIGAKIDAQFISAVILLVVRLSVL